MACLWIGKTSIVKISILIVNLYLTQPQLKYLQDIIVDIEKLILMFRWKPKELKQPK